MNRAYIKRLAGAAIAVCVAISQVSFTAGTYGTGFPAVATGDKSYVSPNPEVYPDMYKTVPETNGKMLMAALQSEPVKESVAPRSSIPAAGSTEKVLVIPVQFRDKAFSSSHSQAYFQSMMTGDKGSLKDFYEKNSGYFWDHSKGITINAVVSPVVTSAYNMSHYGQDSSAYSYDDANGNVYEMAREAVRLLNEQGFDFSSFDVDGNNIIDHLFIIHAGDGQENTLDPNNSLIWSHRWEIGVSGEMVDGKLAKGYATVPETGTVGVFCHEFGHDIGLPDLYDIDGSAGGYTKGVGDWDVMGSGSWNKVQGEPDGSSPANLSAWSRIYMGWASTADITSDTNNVLLSNTNGNSTVIRLWPEGSTARNEYYLAEYRRKAYYDAGLPGEGVLVWHIDKQLVDDAIKYDYGVNTNASRLGVELEQADGEWNLWNMLNEGDGGDPFPGTSENYNFSGVPYGIRLKNGYNVYGFNYSNIDKGQFTYVGIGNFRLQGAEAYMDCHVTRAAPSAAPVTKGPADSGIVTLQPTFSWTAIPEASGYILQFSDTADFAAVIKNISIDSLSDITYNGRLISYTLDADIALAGGMKYYWRVAGENAAGIGAWSTVKSINTSPQTGLVPAVPANIQATATNNSITLTWAASDAATGYYITVDGEELYTAANTYTQTGLDANTRHTYRIRAVNDVNTSALSQSFMAVTTGAPVVSAAVTGSVEGSENGAVVTLELANGIFRAETEPAAFYDKGNVFVNPAYLPSGVTQGDVSRIDDTHLSITLTGNSVSDYDTNRTIYVKVSKDLITTGRYNDVTAAASMPATVESAPAAPAVAFSFTGMNAGKLIGITTAMEYSINGGGTYTAAAGNDIALTADQLAAVNSTNDIRVRIKANFRIPAGTAQVIDIQQAPPAPSVSGSDSENTIGGINSGMEYSSNGGITWTTYNGSNLPDLTGTITLKVRVPADNLTMPGTPVTLVYTATNPPLSIVAATDGLITEGAENGEAITVTLTNGKLAGTLNSDQIQLADIPAGIGKTITRISDTVFTITLSGCSTEDYDVDRTVTVSLGQNQVMPVQPAALTASFILAAVAEPVPAAPDIAFSFDGANSGRLMGITAAMEYSLNGGTSYTAATGTNMVLSAGEIQTINSVNGIMVRAKATLRIPSGEIKAIAIQPGPAAPAVTFDDNANTVSGMDNTMEFSTDGVNWTKFSNNPPELSGNVTLRVRKCAYGQTMAGAVSSSVYTAPAGVDAPYIPPVIPSVPSTPLPPAPPASAPSPAAVPAPIPTPSPTPVTPPSDPIDAVSANKAIDPEQAARVSEYIADLAKALKIVQLNGTDEKKLIEINKTTDRLHDIAAIIENTYDAQSAARLVSETGKMISALLGAADSVKGETNAADMLGSLDRALESSKALLGAVKMDTEKNTAAGMAVSILHTAGSLMDKVSSQDTLAMECKSLITRVSSIAASDRSGPASVKLVSELKTIVERTIVRMNTIDKQAVLKGSGMNTVVSAADVQKLFAKMGTALEIAKQFKTEIASIDGKSAATVKAAVRVLPVKGARSSSITIPASMLNTLQAKGVGMVELSSGIVSVAIAPDTIKTKDISSVILEVKLADNSRDLTAAQRVKAGSSAVYDFNLLLAGTSGKQSRLNKFSKAVEISVPYTPALKQDTSRLTVYYINDRGVLENCYGQFNQQSGSITFKTSHFSKYMISANKALFGDSARFGSYEKYIDFAAENDIIKAKAGTNFNPGDSISRAELADIIINTFRLSGISEKSLKSSTAYLKSVNPGSTVNRQDIAAAFAKVLKAYKGYTVSAAEQKKYTAFSDGAKISTTAKNSVALVIKYNIMQVKTRNEFRPTDAVSRAEAAKAAYSVLLGK